MPPKNVSSATRKEDRGGIIEAVKTPLGLCALIVLIIEGILGAISLRLTGWDLTILLIGMIAALFVIVLAAGYAIRHPQSQAGQPPVIETKPVSFKYDVFLSVPMAGFSSENEYQAARKDALQVIETLRTECGFKDVSYAAQFIETMADFDAADLSVIDDLKALRDSKYFVMIYPSRIVSSCIFEAGYAVALGKPSLYFVRDKKHLPFLLQQAGEALNTLVRIREVSDVAETTKLICKHKLALFPS
jgi:nucleoside 2-deoxyribosyltransferase